MFFPLDKFVYGAGSLVYFLDLFKRIKPKSGFICAYNKNAMRESSIHSYMSWLFIAAS